MFDFCSHYIFIHNYGRVQIVALYFLFLFICECFEVKDAFSKTIVFPVLLTLLTIGGEYVYFASSMTYDDQIFCSEVQFKKEKRALEEARAKDIKEAETQVKLAEIEAKRLMLTFRSTESSIKHQHKLKLARESLAKLKAKGVDYSSMSKHSEQEKQTPVDERFKLILSALWLGACFFLQRIFEKLFHDKGYALLAVCAAGFLVAFFSANYFLLGGSITGGLMGSAGGNKT